MVGSVGMVRGISRPGSLVIQEALNLLSALGSDSKGTTKKLLTEMKGVQDHNEVVLADAKVVIVEADRREAQVVEEEAELARNLVEAEKLYAGRLSEIINSERELQRRAEEVDAQVIVENGAISTREDKLRSDQEDHQESLRTSKEALAKRESILENDNKVLEELISSLESRKEKIDSDRMVLDDLQDSLDELKTELDTRDARVRAAMEGETVVGGE